VDEGIGDGDERGKGVGGTGGEVKSEFRVVFRARHELCSEGMVYAVQGR